MKEIKFDGVEYDALGHLIMNRKSRHDDFTDGGLSIHEDNDIFFKDEEGNIYTQLIYCDSDGDDKDYDYYFLCTEETFKKEIELHNKLN